MQEYAKRFLGSEVEAKNAENCFYHIIPVPYEASVSYGGGTAKGPDAILDASDQLELFNGHSSPEKEEFSPIFLLTAENLPKLSWKIFTRRSKMFLLLKNFPFCLAANTALPMAR